MVLFLSISNFFNNKKSQGRKLNGEKIHSSGNSALIITIHWFFFIFNLEAEHDRQVQEERNQKKAEKSKIIAQESVYGIVKTPNRGVVGKDKTMNKVKRLQHESKVSNLIFNHIRDHPYITLANIWTFSDSPTHP